ncbi:MAG: hypothetical protein ACLRWP_06900 [Bilophila wadsworthia]
MPSEDDAAGAGMGSACEGRLRRRLRLGTLFPENVDELDVLIFGGDVRVAAPEAPSVAKVSSLPPWERM